MNYHCPFHLKFHKCLPLIHRIHVEHHNGHGRLPCWKAESSSPVTTNSLTPLETKVLLAVANAHGRDRNWKRGGRFREGTHLFEYFPKFHYAHFYRVSKLKLSVWHLTVFMISEWQRKVMIKCHTCKTATKQVPSINNFPKTLSYHPPHRAKNLKMHHSVMYLIQYFLNVLYTWLLETILISRGVLNFELGT